MRSLNPAVIGTSAMIISAASSHELFHMYSKFKLSKAFWRQEWTTQGTLIYYHTMATSIIIMGIDCSLGDGSPLSRCLLKSFGLHSFIFASWANMRKIFGCNQENRLSVACQSQMKCWHVNRHTLIKPELELNLSSCRTTHTYSGNQYRLILDFIQITVN